MEIDHNSLLPVVVILSATLIGVVALIRNTPGSLIINFGNDRSFILEGKTTSLPEQNKIDCLPQQVNSQLQDCDV